VSNSESLVVLICYVDKVKDDLSCGWKKFVKDSYLKPIEVHQCTDGDLHTPLTSLLLKEMEGQGGVQAKLSLDLPNLFVSGCVCYTIHLCTSSASQKLPEDTEEFCQDIYNYISRSSKRTGESMQKQKFMEHDKHRILHHVTTRCFPDS